MPYSNIVFIKLFLSLFEEDDRFLYQLNESQQLLYIKMLYMAGTTNNYIPKNPTFIKNKINYHHENDCFLADVERIKIVFPNGFLETDACYKFKNFNDLHNYIGSSKGLPKEIQRSSKGVAREEKNKRRVRGDIFSPPTTKEVGEYCIARKNNINPDKFINYYTANGWLVGKNKMKNWQAAVNNWAARENKGSDRRIP